MTYTLMMAKNLLGRLLLKDKSRHPDAYQHIEHSEKLAKILPYWWGDMDHLYVQQWVGIGS